MKIAYLCADQGVPVLGNKGASVHVREFTDALVKLGHQVQVYSAAGTPKGAPQISANTTRAVLTVLPPSDQVKNTARMLAGALERLVPLGDTKHLASEVLHAVADPAFITAALPALREFGPDLIITRHALFSTAGLTLARSLGCACILEVNAPLVDERRRYWGLTLDREAEQTERAVFANVDLLVAVSEGVRAYLLRYDAPPGRIVVLPNGVNLADFHPGVDGSDVRLRYRLEDKLVIGFAGSLKPWHGVDVLMRAFASARNDLNQRKRAIGSALHLLIIGDGPQRVQLGQLCHELGINDAVTFTGAIPHADMPAHLAAVEIAVAPYVSGEEFYFSPLKVMEYMAMGRAIIAPMLGQIPALLQGPAGACGLLYAPDDERALAATLLRFIGDQELRQQLGARAAAHARSRSSWETIAQQILDRAGPENGRMVSRQLEVILT